MYDVRTMGEAMRIFIHTKPRSRHSRVERIDDTHYVVAVTAPPVDGKANEAVLEAIALHFHLRKSDVRLISGQSSRKKVVEIP